MSSGRGPVRRSVEANEIPLYVECAFRLDEMRELQSERAFGFSNHFLVSVCVRQNLVESRELIPVPLVVKLGEAGAFERRFFKDRQTPIVAAFKGDH